MATVTEPATTAAWGDLATTGAVVLRGFLSPADVEVLARDYHEQTLSSNRNVNIKHVSRPAIEQVRAKLMGAADQIRAAAGIDVDTIVGGGYFAIELGINNEWHQDHESFFLFQEHVHYLNFWIPIEKPDPARTNLSFVPLTALAARAPELARTLVGGGAVRCLTGGGESHFHGDDERIRYAKLDFDIDDIAVTPSCRAGDVILLRGDVFHRTQDTATQRIAVSFRMVSSKSTVTKQRLLQGGPCKRRMLQSNPWLYALALQCFRRLGRDEITAGELLDYLAAPEHHVIRTGLSLLELGARWTMALPPAEAFARPGPTDAGTSALALLRLRAADALARRGWPGRRLADDASAELARVVAAMEPSPLPYVRAVGRPVLAEAVSRLKRLVTRSDRSRAPRPQ